MNTVMEELLKAIPNNTLIKDTENDEKLNFLVDEYQELIEEGEDLPTLTDESTFGDVKKNLNTLPLAAQLDFVARYKYKYSKEGRLLAMKEKRFYTRFLVIYLITLVTGIIILAGVIGSLNKDLNSTVVIQEFFGLVGRVIPSLFGLPSSGMN